MPILILLRVAPFVGELPLHGSGAILIRELTGALDLASFAGIG